MATYETLLVDRPRAGIVVATLNRPDRLNALTFGMFDELARLAADTGADDRVRVLVLTGAGRGFCAGLDLADAATLPSTAEPGKVMVSERRMFVSCSKSTWLELLEVQLEGKKRLPAADFLLGMQLGANSEIRLG